MGQIRKRLRFIQSLARDHKMESLELRISVTWTESLLSVATSSAKAKVVREDSLILNGVGVAY